MNNSISPPLASGHFNERMYIDAVMSFAKIRNGLNDISRNLIYQLPSAAGPWTFPSGYHLTAYALEHILKRHYAPFDRSVATSKFTIPLLEITALLRQAYQEPAQPIVKVASYERTLDTGRIIGRDQQGQESSIIRVVIDRTGWIKTAYPIPNAIY
ncbi:hypothetical protein [Paraflavitalea pollutisoli]|uniref:hypothetical protein n=1 Tax=Paraflavitalea pollutisoli TaxID=3034143 RepID=UPI0023EC13EA|nr:hypothetical protein [Paraflavitalea sp. H1-2-19X]